MDLPVPGQPQVTATAQANRATSVPLSGNAMPMGDLFNFDDLQPPFTQPFNLNGSPVMPPTSMGLGTMGGGVVGMNGVATPPPTDFFSGLNMTSAGQTAPSDPFLDLLPAQPTNPPKSNDPFADLL